MQKSVFPWKNLLKPLFVVGHGVPGAPGILPPQVGPARRRGRREDVLDDDLPAAGVAPDEVHREVDVNGMIGVLLAVDGAVVAAGLGAADVEALWVQAYPQVPAPGVAVAALGEPLLVREHGLDDAEVVLPHDVGTVPRDERHLHASADQPISRILIPAHGGALNLSNIAL